MKDNFRLKTSFHFEIKKDSTTLEGIKPPRALAMVQGV